jgi:hypothetical protein
MTREEFLDRIDEIMCGTSNAERACFEELYDEVTKPHWISVEDELPPREDESLDLSIDVLATNGNEVYKTFYDYYLQRWVRVDDFNLDDITHWMPLPQAPLVTDINKKDLPPLGRQEGNILVEKKGGENEQKDS